MSSARFLVIVGLMAVAAAGVVALVSRTPESVRAAKPPSTSTDPSLGAGFTDAQVSRAAHFRGPSYLSFAIGVALQVVTLLLVARGPAQRFVGAFERVRGGWPVRTVLAVVALTLLLSLVSLPLAFVRGHAAAHAWGLSTQGLGGWMSDELKGTAVSAVTLSVAGIAFFGLVRWQQRAWPLLAWAVFSLLTLLLTFLFPIAIAPLFNDFTPLQDQELARAAKALAARAGVDVDEVLVADNSKRSTAENAYVAGIGASKQLVLYDTLLEGGTNDETLFVVAHELGHEAHNHVIKNVLVASVGLAAGFAALAWLAHRPAMWSWGGASSITDLRALPLLVLFALVAALILLPVQNAISRHFEAQADRVAIELTHDPETAVRVFRRLAFSNIADLRPPAVAVWTLFSHPPIVSRIDSVLAESAGTP